MTLLRTNFPRVTGLAKPGRRRKAMPGTMPKGLKKFLDMKKKAKKPTAASKAGAKAKPRKMKMGGMVKKAKY